MPFVMSLFPFFIHLLIMFILALAARRSVIPPCPAAFSLKLPYAGRARRRLLSDILRCLRIELRKIDTHARSDPIEPMRFRSAWILALCYPTATSLRLAVRRKYEKA